MRKLATIRRIDAINPIPNADAIEVATVGGWNVVVKKGEFRVNDFALYLEIDSWVPTELAPFLSKGKEPREYQGIKGERLKTVRLRGQVSQGLLLPLKTDHLWNKLVDKTVPLHPITYKDFIEIVETKWQYPEFQDVDYSEILGIVKWEPNIPAQLAGIMRGNFPSFIQKTDQERIQNIKRQFEDAVAAGEEFEVTEKLDGSSMTVYFNNGDFGVCSRNIDLKESDDNAFWKMAKSLNLKEKLETYGKNIALQGELIGNGIQGNQYYLPGHEYRIFDVYDIDAGGKMLPGERQAVLRDLGLQFVNEVPQLLPRYKFSPETTISDVLKMAESYSMLNGSEREGLVFKSLTRDFSFKAISNKWLLNNE